MTTPNFPLLISDTSGDVTGQLADDGTGQLAVAAGVELAGVTLPDDFTVDVSWQQTPPPASLVGSTVNVAANTYAQGVGGELSLVQAAAWDEMVCGGQKCAQLVQKIYLQPGDLPAALNADRTAFANAGGSVLVSMKPNRAFSASEDAAFTACVQAFYAAFGSRFKPLIWQEMNLSKDDWTASAYVPYHQHYAELVKEVNADIPVVWDPGAYHFLASDGAAYFPGYAYVDEIGCDVYGDDPNYAPEVTAIAAIANAAPNGPIPFGLYEYGELANPTSLTIAERTARWDTFYQWIITFFQGRLEANLPSSWIIGFWCPGGGNNTAEQLAASGDFRVAGIAQLTAALSPVAA